MKSIIFDCEHFVKEACSAICIENICMYVCIVHNKLVVGLFQPCPFISLLMRSAFAMTFVDQYRSSVWSEKACF
ncbi:hypothetical protein T4D_14173 [Trichinella pseudospiralis]|uniref:Uncharacterized protein n=1 Tax=Trichinella pseudospiralis TaxID=6337 RepID=A0A0V1FZ55_TRIPS|nr:hypothetical protein T4D_14173 [Trichinella pseudospiralis]